MPEPKGNKKTIQLSLEEYNKVKEKRAKSKLKLQFPWGVKIFFIIPALYLLFLITYYLMDIRFH